MFRRHHKNQGYGAQSGSTKNSGDDHGFTSNLRDLGILGSRSSKSIASRPATGSASQQFTDVPTFPEKGMFVASLTHLGLEMPHPLHRGLLSEGILRTVTRNLLLTLSFQVDQSKPDLFAPTTARDLTRPLPQ